MEIAAHLSGAAILKHRDLARYRITVEVLPDLSIVTSPQGYVYFQRTASSSPPNEASDRTQFGYLEASAPYPPPKSADLDPLEAIRRKSDGLLFSQSAADLLIAVANLDPCMIPGDGLGWHHAVNETRKTEIAMFTLIHTSFSESNDKMAIALQFENPFTGSRYTFRCGLEREHPSSLDDVASYSRRVDDYRRSIELSANP